MKENNLSTLGSTGTDLLEQFMLGQGTDDDSMSSLLFTIVNTGWKSNTMALTMSHKGRRLEVERRHLGTNSKCSYWKEGSWLFTCYVA